MYSNGSRCGLIRYLKKKIEFFRRQGLSHILEMNIIFVTFLDLITYDHYINQSMQMVERVPNKKLYKKPQLVEMLKDVHFILLMGRKQTTLDEK